MGEDPRTDGPAADAGQDPDPLRRLEQRLDLASAGGRAADHAGGCGGRGDRAQAAARRLAGARVRARTRTRTGTELDLLLEAVHALRDRIPPDLQRRLGEALRELLLALRALIDWYLERSQRSRTQEPEVQDIPIS